MQRVGGKLYQVIRYNKEKHLNLLKHLKYRDDSCDKTNQLQFKQNFKFQKREKMMKMKPNNKQKLIILSAMNIN